MDLSMEICMCMGVTVGDIKAAVDGGAKSFDEVQQITQAGTVCGQCEDDVRELVAELLKPDH